jgi:type II secretory pathway pseudopilin PulG
MLLLESQGQLQRHWSELSEAEREFIAASQGALAQRRWQTERQLRRNRRTMIGSIAAAVVTSLLAVATLIQWKDAVDQRKDAVEQRMIAEEAGNRAREQAQLAALANLSAASAISPDGRRMLQIDPGGYLRIIDLANGRDVGRIETDYGQITAAIFSPDSTQIAVGSADKVVYIYDTATMQETRRLVAHTDRISRLAYSPDGRLLASGSDDSTARVWSAADGRLAFVVRADGPVVSIAFSPDGSRLVISSKRGTLYFVDTQSGQILH